MAKRYTKLYSNYILSKKHQHTTKGTIWERDWVTIGNDHQIEPGKRSFYYDGNFLFTTNNFIQTKKKRKASEYRGVWNYDDVENASTIVNKVSVNRNSKDIRDFAYYGSASELFRVSVENIVKWFPGRITTSDQHLTAYTEDGEREIEGFIISNPYGIDLYHIVTDFDGLNKLRYFESSYSDYVCSVNGSDEYYPIIGYDIKWEYMMFNGNVNYNKLNEEDYNELCDSDVKESCYEYDDDTGLYTPIKVIKESVYESLLAEGCYNVSNNYVYPYNYRCIGNYEKLFEITLTLYDGTENDNEVKIFGYLVNESIVFVTENNDTKIIIAPSQSVIDDYFDNLDGFEKQLLTRSTDPLYTNTFLTPFETDRGYVYRYRTYTWPSVDGFISVSSLAFEKYVEDMQNLTELMDELWCDNIWRNMTHESIKNYDRTYTRVFEEGDSEEFIEGGGRIEKLIRVYGRVFDDIKREIDGIKLSAVVTYDGLNNMPDAEISDKTNYKGWEIYTTIPLLYTEHEEEIVNDRKDFLRRYGYEWFTSEDTNSKDFEEIDIDFNRELLVSSKFLSKSKGTRESIEMVMAMFGFGGDDFSIIENYRYTVPKDFSDDLAKEFGEVNSQENPDAIYGDYYKEIPVEDIYLNDNRYIVPYFDEKKHYKGNIAFQSDGAWGFISSDNRYSETVPYMRSVQNISELLSVSPFTVSAYDMFYVESLLDYNQYVEDAFDISNFFYLVNSDNPESFSSWRSVSLSEKLYTGTFYMKYVVGDDGEYIEYITEEQWYELSPEERGDYELFINTLTKQQYEEITKDYVQDYDSVLKDSTQYEETPNPNFDSEMYNKAMYLDSITSDERGNNPHTGYGKYDFGTKFDEYMQNPFKYMLENTVIEDDDIYKKAYSDDLNFSLTSLECEWMNGKVKNLAFDHDRYCYTDKPFINGNYRYNNEDRYADAITPSEYESLTNEEQACYDEIYVEASTGELVEKDVYDAWYDEWSLSGQGEVIYEIKYVPKEIITGDMYDSLSDGSELKNKYIIASFYFYKKNYDVIDYIKYNEINTPPNNEEDEWEAMSPVYITKSLYDSFVYYKKDNFNTRFIYIDGVTTINYDEYLAKTEEEKLLYTREFITKEQYDILTEAEKAQYYSWRDFLEVYEQDSQIDKMIDETDEIPYLEEKLRKLLLKAQSDKGTRYDSFEIDDIKAKLYDIKYNSVCVPFDSNVIMCMPKYYLNSKILTFVNNLTHDIFEYVRFYYVKYNNEGTKIDYKDYIELDDEQKKDYYKMEDTDDVISQEEYDQLSYFDKLNRDSVKKTVCNKYFKQYFFDIIYPYITQVIPSTTMLRFEGFDV